MSWIKKHIPLLATITALSMIALGILAAEPAVMWRKAVNICLSCIGIG